MSQISTGLCTREQYSNPTMEQSGYQDRGDVSINKQFTVCVVAILVFLSNSLHSKPLENEWLSHYGVFCKDATVVFT